MSNIIDEFGPFTLADEDDTDMDKDIPGGVVTPDEGGGDDDLEENTI